MNYSKRILSCLHLAVFLFLFATGLHSQIERKNLALWLRADTGLVMSGDSIESWNDLGPGKHQAKCSSTESPVVRNQGKDAFAAVIFNGRNTGLQTDIISTFEKKRGSIFLVVKINGASERSSVGMGTIVSTYHGEGTCWQFGANTRKLAYYDGIGGEGMPVSGTTMGSWMYLSLIRNTDTTLCLYTNGQLSSTIQIHNNQPDLNTIKIGYNGMTETDTDDISEVLNGEIAEIIIYNTALDEDQAVLIHNYLSERYGISPAPPPFYKTWWFYTGTGALIVLLIFSVYKTIRARNLAALIKQMQTQQRLEQERLRIARDIHDELGAGLSRIALISGHNSSADNPNDESIRNGLNDISKTSRELIENMRDLVWTLNADTISMADLWARMREYSYEYTGNLNLKLDFIQTGPAPDITLSKNAHRNLLLIFKEALNNSIRHGNPDSISIHIGADEKEFSIEVKDDGKGFDSSEKKNGNGLRNMSKRTELMGGHFSIQSSPGKGTTVRISVSMASIGPQEG